MKLQASPSTSLRLLSLPVLAAMLLSSCIMAPARPRPRVVRVVRRPRAVVVAAPSVAVTTTVAPASAGPPPASTPALSSTAAQAEYRNGYDIGAHDASTGQPNDPAQAFDRSGRSMEDAFKAGYADGYARRGSRY